MIPRGDARFAVDRERLSWLGLGLVSLIALLWSCRGAPLGTAATDDYTFLAARLFQHPLDWLGTMDAPYYWRPVGRQLYFSLVGPWMLAHPWGVVALHASILIATGIVIVRIARRGFSPAVAAMIAAFPLSAESARVLLGWASGGQHLLAMLGATLAIHEALAGRRMTAAAAAFFGVLSHESAALALPALPAIAWFRTHRARTALEWFAIAAAIAILVTLGHEAARGRGMVLPSDVPQGFPWGRFGEGLGLGLSAALNLEDLPPALSGAFAAGYALLGAAAIALLWRRGTAQLAAAAPVLLGGTVWFVAGVAPLAFILPDWNAWRATVPTLGFGVATLGLLGSASRWLAGAFFALRLAALLVAAPAPEVVTALPPATTSHASFVRLTRIQRTVESTRLALTHRYPRLPHDAVLRYWLIPALTEVGFEGPRAVRVWYRDSTLRWEPFAGAAGLREPADALVEYNALEASPATVIEPAALALFAQALDAMAAGDAATADQLLAACFVAQPKISEPFYASLAYSRARMAIVLGNLARADSLNRLDFQWAGESGRAFAVRARIAAARGDFAGAEEALRRSLTLEPRNADAISLARELRLIP